jgi:predicted dehydrogenase
MDQFRWGIIGPGNIADSFISDMQFCKTATHTATAVLHHSIDKAKKFGDKHGISAVYDSLENFVDEAKVDAVYIATPHTLHYEQTIACLKKGIPVLCEKPMGINKIQVEEMIQTAKENDTFLMEGMWVRFLPSLAKITEIIEKGSIGPVQTIKATLSFKAPYDENNRYFNPDLGGGSLLDLGIYPVFLSVYLLGKPERLKAIAHLTDEKIDEACSVFCEYSEERKSFLDCSLVTKSDNKAIIYGEKGYITIAEPWNEKPSEIRIDYNDGNFVSYPCNWEGEGLHYEMDEVCSNIKEGRKESRKMSFNLSLDMINMLDVIREKSGIEYPREEILNPPA